MVWGIVYDRQSPPLFVRESMTAEHLIDDALQTTLRSYLDSRPRDLLEHDNALLHIALWTMGFLQDKGVKVLPWLPQLPDLNDMEHVGIWCGLSFFPPSSTNCSSLNSRSSNCLKRGTTSVHGQSHFFRCLDVYGSVLSYDVATHFIFFGLQVNDSSCKCYRFIIDIRLKIKMNKLFFQGEMFPMSLDISRTTSKYLRLLSTYHNLIFLGLNKQKFQPHIPNH